MPLAHSYQRTDRTDQIHLQYLCHFFPPLLLCPVSSFCLCSSSFLCRLLIIVIRLESHCSAKSREHWSVCLSDRPGILNSESLSWLQCSQSLPGNDWRSAVMHNTESAWFDLHTDSLFLKLRLTYLLCRNGPFATV